MASPTVGKQKVSAIMPHQKFEGHTESVSDAIYLSGGQRMMTCSADGSLRVWNLKSGKQIGDEWMDGESQVYVWIIALSPDGKKVVSGSMDGGVRLWNMDTGKVIAKWSGHTEGVRTVCWSRDGQRVLSGSIDGTARQWDVENGKTILVPIKTGHERVYAAVYSPDMTMFATGGCEQLWSIENDKSPVKIWDTKTAKLVATLEGHTDAVQCLAWTPDGTTLISGSSDRSIRTWSTTTWKQIAVLEGHTWSVISIAISPNGRIVASASWDDTARLWNLDNNQPISSPLHHTDRVFSVSFSVDGKLLATSCWDRIAYTWDVSAIVKEVGLDELLLDQRNKSLLAPIKVSNLVPQEFFNGTPYRAHSSARLNPHDTPLRPRLFHWVRNLFSGRPGGAEIELRKHHSAVVDAPHCQAQRRNASAREKRRSIPKKASASSSRPPNSNVTQRSFGTAQAQSSSQPQCAISTSSTTPAVVATPEVTAFSTNPHVTIKHAGLWTRFWLFICCASIEYTDGHH